VEASPSLVRQPQVEISSDESESESDSDSEEDSSAKALNKPTTTSNSRSRSSPAIKQEPDVENNEEVVISEIEDVEIASAHSTRESRSPVVFQKHIHSDESGESPNLTKSQHLGSLEPQSSEESEANAESDSGEESMPEDDEGSESEEEPAHPQSSQQLPPLRVNDKAATQKETNDSKPLSDDDSNATQDEVDLQLTSDMFEVEKAPSTIASAVRPNPILPSSSSKTIRPPIRPSFRIGASLSSFNNKANGNGARAVNSSANHTKQPFKGTQSDEGSADESDSGDSDDESSSESEKEIPQKQVSNSSQKSISKPAVESTSSDSDSDSESESAFSESEDDTTRHRNELTAKLIKSANGNDSNSEDDTIRARKEFTAKLRKLENGNSQLPSSQGSVAASQKMLLSSSQNGRKDGEEKKSKGDRIAGNELKKKKKDLVFGYKFAPYE